MKPRPPLPSDPPGGSGRSRLGSPGLPVCRSVGVAGGAGYLYGNGYGSAPPAGDFPQWLGSGVGGGALSRAEQSRPAFFFGLGIPSFLNPHEFVYPDGKRGLSQPAPLGAKRDPRRPDAVRPVRRIRPLRCATGGLPHGCVPFYSGGGLSTNPFRLADATGRLWRGEAASPAPPPAPAPAPIPRGPAPVPHRVRGPTAGEPVPSAPSPIPLRRWVRRAAGALTWTQCSPTL